jgi:hypothetical protein
MATIVFIEFVSGHTVAETPNTANALPPSGSNHRPYIANAALLSSSQILRKLLVDGMSAPLLDCVPHKRRIPVNHMREFAVWNRDEQAGDYSQVNH